MEGTPSHIVRDTYLWTRALAHHYIILDADANPPAAAGPLSNLISSYSEQTPEFIGNIRWSIHRNVEPLQHDMINTWTAAGSREAWGWMAPVQW